MENPPDLSDDFRTQSEDHISKKRRERRAAQQQARGVESGDRCSGASTNEVSSGTSIKQFRLISRSSRDVARMDSKVASLVSFGTQKQLLRASWLSSLMRHGAVLFAKGKGDAKTYALSKVVDSIDIFISHNWAVPRWKKFMCLALHFNFRLAVAAAVAALIIMAFAASQGVRLLVVEAPIHLFPSFGHFEHGLGCTLVMTPVLVLSACFGHELKRLVGCHGCTVFLDKTCIHQVDKDLQREGISKLGAFLASSSRMMVLYTDLYLSKLWTVYEVACFLSLHTADNLIVIPTHQPMIIFGAVVLQYTRMVLEMLMIGSGGDGQVFLVGSVFNLGMAFALLLLLRRSAQAQEAIRQRMANFEVQECACACEEDRPIVFQHIALLMGAIGAVDSDAVEQDALTAFNMLVRERLPRTLAASNRPLGLQYHQVVGFWLCTSVARAFDQELVGVYFHHEEDMVTRFRICQFALRLTWCFGINPCVVVLMSTLARCCLKVRGGCSEFLLLVLLGLFMMILGLVIYVPFRAFIQMSVEDGPYRNVCAGMIVFGFFASTSLAIFLFNRGPRLQDNEETEAVIAYQMAHAKDEEFEYEKDILAL